jgi:chromosome segregation ATPase
MAKEKSEIDDLTQSIDRLEVAAFNARRSLADIADKRENLLNDESASIGQFSALNSQRDSDQVAIDRAARVVPRLRERLNHLHEERRALRAAEYHRMLTLQAKKIEGALQELVAANGVAVDLMRKARDEL